jgi:hypothetical protein
VRSGSSSSGGVREAAGHAAPGARDRRRGGREAVRPLALEFEGRRIPLVESCEGHGNPPAGGCERRPSPPAGGCERRPSLPAGVSAPERASPPAPAKVQHLIRLGVCW